MSRIVVTSWRHFFSRVVNVRPLAVAGEARAIERSPEHRTQEPATMDEESLDAAAGSEFIDDRIRIRE